MGHPRRVLAALLTLLSASGIVLVRAADRPAGLVADMEGNVAYKAAGRKTPPKVSVTTTTASQGRASLRLEHTGEGDDPAWVTCALEGAAGYDTLAFDLYVERHDASSFSICLGQAAATQGGSATFTAKLKLSEFIDGWTPVRLVKDSGLVFKTTDATTADWSKLRGLSFTIAAPRSGTTVLYLDNIRFENLGGGRAAANMLYNSSFEIATNPDVPDGWTRDLSIPPFSLQAWGIDAGTAWHGRQSLRIGAAGKYARSWGRHTYLVAGQEYTFSAYLKSDREGVKAEIRVPGMAQAEVSLTPQWRRHSVSGKAAQSATSAYVTLKSEGVVWVDATQLELGRVATEYAPSPAEGAPADGAAAAEPEPAPASEGLAAPAFRVRRASAPPRIDGDLGDACWQEAAPLTPFLELESRSQTPGRRTSEPAASDSPGIGSKANRRAVPQTVAKMCYDAGALYFAVRAEEPDMRAVVELLQKSRQGPWDTDLVEIFVDLSHDHKTCYHFAANAAGAQWTARHAPKTLFSGSPQSWSAPWTVAGKSDAAGWTLEVRIPYTCFDLRPEIPVGKVLGVNIARTDPRNNKHSSWAFSGNRFLAPERFGEARGFDAELAPFRYESLGVGWSQGVARAVVRNHTGRDQAGRIEFVATWDDGRQQRATASASCAAGGDLRVSTPLTLEHDGTCRLVARFLDESDAERFVAQPVVLRVSKAKPLDLVGTEFDFYSREPQARARCFVETGDCRPEAVSLDWQVMCRGKPVGEPARVCPKRGANEWIFPVAGLSEGDYEIRTALWQSGKRVAEQSSAFRKLPPLGHEVRINRWGRFLVCDGKPLLWYGFYHSMARVSDEQFGASLDDMRSVGSTAVLNYVGGAKEYRRVGWALDQAHARGMKMWVRLGRRLSYWITKFEGRSDRYKNEEEAVAALTEVVRKHKDHPALLGWCTLDEPGNRPTLFTKDYTEKYYNLIKRLDPHHPCIFSHLQRVGESAIYGHATDLALVPFVHRSSSHERVFWEFWDHGLPLATNSPCYGALGGAVREPTPAEQRVRMYRALIMGARGLCTYTYRCITTHTWKEFERVGRELERLAPILLTPDDRLRVEVVAGGPDVSAMLKAHAGSYYLLAVNTGPSPAEVTLAIGDVPRPGTAKPLFASPPATVDAGQQTLRLLMSGQSTAVYQISSD